MKAVFLQFFFFFFFFFLLVNPTVENDFFYDKYFVTFGNDRVKVSEKEQTVELHLDNSYGAGFRSKAGHGSGFFNILMKLPSNRDSHSILSTFYLTSKAPNGGVHDYHDELDFEWYGSDHLPMILQTNVFVGGHGNREQQIALWFDPRADFHSYTILWNHWNVAFFVDDIPVRVFKNLSHVGQRYITQPMHVEGTLWYADWAGGGRPVDWSQSPFVCSYKGFNNIRSCQTTTTSLSFCNSLNRFNWWNAVKYRSLNARQQSMYKSAKKYIVYDYCTDRLRNPIPPPECRYNS